MSRFRKQMPEPFDPIPPHQHKIDIRFVLQPDGIEKMDTVTLHALMYHLAQDITSHCQAGVGKLLSIPSSTNRISFTKRYVFSSSTSSRTNMELRWHSELYIRQWGLSRVSINLFSVRNCRKLGSFYNKSRKKMMALQFMLARMIRIICLGYSFAQEHIKKLYLPVLVLSIMMQCISRTRNSTFSHSFRLQHLQSSPTND